MGNPKEETSTEDAGYVLINYPDDHTNTPLSEKKLQIVPTSLEDSDTDSSEEKSQYDDSSDESSTSSYSSDELDTLVAENIRPRRGEKRLSSDPESLDTEQSPVTKKSYCQKLNNTIYSIYLSLKNNLNFLDQQLGEALPGTYGSNNWFFDLEETTDEETNETMGDATYTI